MQKKYIVVYKRTTVGFNYQIIWASSENDAREQLFMKLPQDYDCIFKIIPWTEV